MKELPKDGVDEIAGGDVGYDQIDVLPLPAVDYPQLPGPCTDSVTRTREL